jgi:hypothetical protein
MAMKFEIRIEAVAFDQGRREIDELETAVKMFLFALRADKVAGQRRYRPQEQEIRFTAELDPAVDKLNMLHRLGRLFNKWEVAVEIQQPGLIERFRLFPFPIRGDLLEGPRREAEEVAEWERQMLEAARIVEEERSTQRTWTALNVTDVYGNELQLEVQEFRINEQAAAEAVRMDEGLITSDHLADLNGYVAASFRIDPVTTRPIDEVPAHWFPNRLAEAWVPEKLWPRTWDEEMEAAEERALEAAGKLHYAQIGFLNDSRRQYYSTPIDQDRVTQVFLTSGQDDADPRRLALRRHARALWNKMRRSNRSEREIADFIKSLGLA